jgi:hypothetical protein
MPTVGWIQETAEDRYWERIGLGYQYPTRPEILYCPYCTSQFESTGKLSTHVSVDHPIERPLIFFSNRLSVSELIIRSPINKDEIELTHVNLIKVCKDGGESEELSPDELKNELSNNDQGHYSIKLFNGDPIRDRIIEANYIVIIKIANQFELDAVDECFIHTLAKDNVAMSDVRHFADACAKYPSADEYSNALSVFVTGVLIKDQNENTGVTLPFSFYKEKMQQALETLRDFDRAIPKTICASIKFNLNDFGRSPLTSGTELLDVANEFFCEVVSRGTVQFTSEEGMLAGEKNLLPACPIDRDSFYLLKIYRRIHRGSLDQLLIAELYESSISRTLSDYDLSKLQVLTAIATIQAGDAVKGGTILEGLVNDPIFGDWAESEIKSKG